MATTQEDMMEELALALMDEGDAAGEMLEAVDAGTDPDEGLLDESEILNIIESEMRNATTGTFATKVDADREEALRYYLGNPRGDEQEGRSQIVSTDVADAIEWILPQIMKALTSKGAVVEFDAVSQMDESQAQLETQFVHDVFMKENNGFLNLYEYIKDALLMKNGVFKIYYDDTPETKTEQYTGLNQQELDMLLADPDVTPTELVTQPDEAAMPAYEQQVQQMQMQAQQMAMQMQQMPPEQQGQAQQQLAQMQQQIPPPPTVTDVTLERVCSYGKVKVECVTPEEFRVNQYHNSLDLRQARFVAHSTLKTASELIEEGYDEDTIKDHLNNVNDYYRREYRFAEQDETTYSQYGYSEDESQSLIEVSECYMHIDINQDDVAELMKITVMGAETVTAVLDIEPIDEIPFVSSSTIIMPHKHIGLSIHDRLKQLQDQKTSLWRNILDNLYLQNNREKEVVEGQVNIDDLLVSRPGGIKRVKAPGMIRELEVQPIGSEGYTMLEYLDKVRTGRVGVSPDTQGQDLPVGNETAHGVERLMTAKEELTGLMVRVVAETGLKLAYSRIRDLLIKHQDTITAYKYQGQWLDVNPSQWGPRSRMTVKVGTGTGDDMRRQGALQTVMMYQEKLQADPNQTLVKPQQMYNAIDDYAKSAELNTAARYFIDPQSPEGQQIAQEKAQQQQQQQEQQNQVQQVLASAQQQLAQAEQMKGQAAMDSQQAKLQVDSMKIRLDSMKADSDNQKDAYELELKQRDMAIKALQDGAKNDIEREKLRVQEALKLTELEVSHQEELSRQHQQNKQMEQQNGNETAEPQGD